MEPKKKIKSTRLTAYHSYEDYNHKDKKDECYVSKKKYNKVLDSFFEKLAYYLITEGKEIVLPSKLGTLQILKVKGKKVIDRQNTKRIYGSYNKGKKKEDLKFIYKNMSATNNYKWVIWWHRRFKKVFKNYKHYRFKLARPNIRKNTYNKKHAKVRLNEFFLEKGYLTYQELSLNHIDNIRKK